MACRHVAPESFAGRSAKREMFGTLDVVACLVSTPRDDRAVGDLPRYQAIPSKPLRSTRESNLSDGPAGFFSPRSHLLTEILRHIQIGSEDRLAHVLSLAKRLDFVGTKFVDRGQAGVRQTDALFACQSCQRPADRSQSHESPL